MKTTILLLLASASIAGASPEYQLHEWGTFTTVSGSDGVLLAGLDREEEVLPSFVHAHYGLENGQSPDADSAQRYQTKYGVAPFGAPWLKGMGGRPVSNVTVKMETPVIYFHSPEAFRAKVKVGFEGGTISQWYPARSGGDNLPEPEPPSDPVAHPLTKAFWLIDFAKTYHGSIEWDVDVLSPEQSRQQVLFKPADSIGWLRARVPGTNVVRTDKGETEGYLFYRGIGNFQTGLKTTVDSGETLHITNGTGGRIPYLVAFERTGSGELRWVEQAGGLDDKGVFDVPESAFKTEPYGTGTPALYTALQNGLTARGLTLEESRAMVETWWNSYFEKPGLRVFWVLPQASTDRILPLQVSPQPSSIVRVIVGRSEVFRPLQEKAWLTMSNPSTSNAERLARWDEMVSTDRFGMPMASRVRALRQEANPSGAAASTASVVAH